MGMLIEIEPLYVSSLSSEIVSGSSCFLAAALYGLLAILCVLYLRYSRDDDNGAVRVANEELSKRGGKPIRYEKMKLGVRYGSVDIHEKY
jgi:hypothetical protein